ncbi:hypothetical protein [Microvirga sp. G4-2]|uniref:hypothetical protein n=1 Tax=Microvirga sp. G4-2 TaxID=3434467 RepID=UPI004044D113
MLARDEALAVVLAILVALAVTMLAVLAGAFAEMPEAGQGAVREPSCSEWTDGCIVCARTPQGLACSTPGIACVRQAPRCLKP